MALIIGTDTYISQADATSYVNTHYIASDAKRVAWAALASDDKDVLLRKATQIIDSTPVVGAKVIETQLLAFPRAIYTQYMTTLKSSGSYIYSNNNIYIQTEVPLEIKQAQCELAISLINGLSDRQILQKQGVKSFSLSKLSETYNGSKSTLMISSEAQDLMSAFLIGGASIC